MAHTLLERLYPRLTHTVTTAASRTPSGGFPIRVPGIVFQGSWNNIKTCGFLVVCSQVIDLTAYSSTPFVSQEQSARNGRFGASARQLRRPPTRNVEARKVSLSPCLKERPARCTKKKVGAASPETPQRPPAKHSQIFGWSPRPNLDLSCALFLT